MAETRPDSAGQTRLRREVIVPTSPPSRPRLLVALSVALVLMAGAFDAFMWRQARCAGGPEPRAIRVDVNDRLDRLEVNQRLERLGRARGAPAARFPSTVVGSPPY